jgi:hypothetical protein
MRSAANRRRAAAPRSRVADRPRCAVAVAEGDQLTQGRITAALASGDPAGFL